jgi:imidazolonepropionase-like amidohydrolase
MLAALAFGQSPESALVIRDVRVFDGARVLEHTSVLVRDGKIVSVAKSVEAPAGARVIEGAGKTLLPGLFDAHTHVVAPDSLKQALVFGVTTELDMFTSQAQAAQIKKDQAAGKLLDYADLRSAGTLATAPGGHGTEYGLRIPTITRPEEAQAFVDARIAEGSDYIKIIYDDGSSYGLKLPTLSKATLAALIAAAHQRGRMAVVHTVTLPDARTAIEAGADAVVHLFADQPPDAGFARLVAAHHAFVIPTLSVLRSGCGTAAGASLVRDPRLAPYLPPAEIANLVSVFPFRMGSEAGCAATGQTVRQLKAAGVPLLAGTDAPNPGTAHGVSLHGELELLVEAGLTPLEALAAATSVPADRFRLPDRGRIAPGLRADLLLVNGDPTTDIKATRDIVAVWKAGAPVDRAAQLAAIARQKAQDEKARQAPGPAGSESGLISDFEGERVSAKFGAGWGPTTDSMMGGKSTVELKLEPGGAQDSHGSLLVTGEVRPGSQFPWAGAMFSPGPYPMTPVNLSSKQRLSFWAKGDGKSYNVLVFARVLGMQPAFQSFQAGVEWKQFSFPWTSFKGIDGHDVMSIMFTAGAEPGKFVFQIDDVRLE